MMIKENARIVMGGPGFGELLSELDQDLHDSESRSAIGVASAFVSVAGIRLLKTLLDRPGEYECRFVAGIDRCITQPEALYVAREWGWNLRLGSSHPWMFHPKMVIAGERFGRQGKITNPSFFYIGSGNMTEAGLKHNLECGVFSGAPDLLAQTSTVFASMWQKARPASDKSLASYSERFADRVRQSTAKSIKELELSDGVFIDYDSPSRIRTRKSPPAHPAISHIHAEVVWAGLESFTGEYAFQIEFPRRSGEVLKKLAGVNAAADKAVLLCPDGRTRQMTYRYYADNGMFRLNVPNDVPEVTWARHHKKGIALVGSINTPAKFMEFRILRPGAEARAHIAKSLALGSWGKTSTRLFGWY